MVRIIHSFSAAILINISPILEELLIDFRELIGPHSGENMAEAVWSTMEVYGLIRKVQYSWMLILDRNL